MLQPCTPRIIGPSLATTFSSSPQSVLFMSVLNDFLAHQYDISQMCHRVVPTLTPSDTYDFIVIGGGASGSVVAGRLGQRNDLRTLLLEAGGDEPPGLSVPSFAYNFNSRNFSIDWDFKTEETNACLATGGSCTYPRGKCLGGTASINGMMYLRGTKADYDKWAADGNPGWSYNDLFPTFLKSENNLQVDTLVSKKYHGVGGPLPVTQFPDYPALADDVLAAATEAGFGTSQDLNGAQTTGFARAQTNSRAGTRFNSARAYVRPLSTHQSLDVMLDSTATKVVIGTTMGKKRVTGVQFTYNNKNYTVNARHGVIICAGAIKSPQLLLLSGVGPKTVLDQFQIPQVLNLPGVGENLSNHASFVLNYLLGTEQAVLDLDWSRVLEYFLHHTGPMSSTGLAQMTARLNTSFSNVSDPDLQIFFGGIIANGSYTGAIGELPYPANTNARKSITIAPVSLHPKSRGRLSLKSGDPFAKPLIQGNYLTVPEDIEVLVEGIRMVQKLVNTTALGLKYNMSLDQTRFSLCGNFTWDTDDFWRCCIKYYTAPENHQAGTCKMGPRSDSLAVVDSNLKIHGIEGLYVMDASIMPFMVSANPFATCVLIAEKGVEDILKTLY